MRSIRVFRDEWAIPPGDDGTVRRALRRQKRRNAFAGAGAFLMVVTSLSYPLLNTSTEVKTEDVVAEFRAAKATIETDADGDAKGPAPARAMRERASGKAPAARASADKSDSASPSRSRTTTAAAPTNRQRDAVGAGGGGQTHSAGSGRGSATAQQTEEDNDRPREGVYTWSIDGYEKAPGVQRQLPEEGHRVVTHHSQSNRWVEHLIFSEQKEMWFDLMLTEEGGFTNSSRNRVKIGPMTQDKTVTFSPPMQVSKWPFTVGETWKGSWTGKTYGTYTGRTFEHTFIEIEDERVEVWASEVRMELRGDVQGTVVTRSWVAPKYSMVVKQYQEANVQSGPGSYYSKWEGTLQSLEPQT